jgi:hypothetical protein
MGIAGGRGWRAALRQGLWFISLKVLLVSFPLGTKASVNQESTCLEPVGGEVDCTAQEFSVAAMSVCPTTSS